MKRKVTVEAKADHFLIAARAAAEVNATTTVGDILRSFEGSRSFEGDLVLDSGSHEMNLRSSPIGGLNWQTTSSSDDIAEGHANSGAASDGVGSSTGHNQNTASELELETDKAQHRTHGLSDAELQRGRSPPRPRTAPAGSTAGNTDWAASAQIMGQVHGLDRESHSKRATPRSLGQAAPEFLMPVHEPAVLFSGYPPFQVTDGAPQTEGGQGFF